MHTDFQQGISERHGNSIVPGQMRRRTGHGNRAVDVQHVHGVRIDDHASLGKVPMKAANSARVRGCRRKKSCCNFWCSYDSYGNFYDDASNSFRFLPDARDCVSG